MYRLKITDTDLEQLRSYVFAAQPRESGAFALAGVARNSDGADILVRRAIQVPPELFMVQREERLEIASQAVNGLVALCEANGLGAVACHSHPEDTPYSPSDDYGEGRVFDTLTRFVPEGAPLASLLFYPQGIRGRVWLPGRRTFVPISEVIVLGRSIRWHATNGMPDAAARADDELYDRQVLAFGTKGQHLISRQKVGIVGVGGTGSPTAEQLARLGVNDFVLVDPDTFSTSNLTRMYGTFGSTGRPRKWPWPFAGRPGHKVDLVATHLERIRPGIRVQRVPRSVVLHDAVRMLTDRDVVFLCTDEHWGRSVVNELAYQYMIPTINLGMRIDSRDGQISAASGGIDVMRPGTACLWCGQSLNAGRISAESMSRKKRRILRGEGYVEDIDSPAPSVISMTTMLSGMAVTVFLQFITDFMGDAGAISRLRYDIMQGTVRRCVTNPAEGCVCQKVKAFGDLKPLSTVPVLPPED